MKKTITAAGCALLLFAGGCQQAQDPGKNAAEKKDRQMANINAGLHNRYNSNDTMMNRRPAWRTLSDRSVIQGRVNIESGRAVGRLILDKRVGDEEAHRLAQRYAVEIKEVYTRYPVHVHVVQEGKNIFSIELR